MRNTFTAAALLSSIFLAGCGDDTGMTPPPQVPAAPSASAEPPPPPPAPPPPAPEPPKPSMLEMQHKELAAVGDAFAKHDAKAFAASFGENVVFKAPGFPDSTGRDALEKWIGAYFAGFPDVKLVTTRLWFKGNVLVHEWVAVGTNTGDFMGIKATGKPMGVHGGSVVWFDDNGVAKELHHYSDSPTLMGQLGLLPKHAPKVRAIATPIGKPEEHVAKDSDDDKAALAWATKFNATFTEKKPDNFLSMLTDDCAYSDFTRADDIKGKKDAGKFFGGMGKVFDGVKLDLANVWSIDGAIIDESSMAATSKGVIGGPKTKGKPMTMHALDITWIKDGKASSGVTYGNGMEILAQLGMLPPPPGAPAPEKKAAEPAKKK